MINIKDFSSKSLQDALKSLKRTSMFNGKVSGLKQIKNF